MRPAPVPPHPRRLHPRRLCCTQQRSGAIFFNRLVFFSLSYPTSIGAPGSSSSILARARDRTGRAPNIRLPIAVQDRAQTIHEATVRL